MPSITPRMATWSLNPASTNAFDTLGFSAATLLSSAVPTALSCALAAIATAAMIRPMTSTASPRFRPGVSFPASKPVEVFGAPAAAQTDRDSSTTCSDPQPARRSSAPAT